MRINSVLAVLLAVVSTPAVAANLSVPGDHATIQEAVNAAAPGDIINVGPGVFAGAFIFQTVTIVGSGPATIIDTGNPFFGFDDAFDILLHGADGTTIRDMTFTGGDFYWGVYAFRADDVTVTNCVFLNTFHAVDNREGNGWTITDNNIDGFIPFPPPGPGVENHQEAILVLGPARDNYIGNNFIRHEGARNPGYLRELNFGVILISFGGTLENNTVVGNEVEVVVPDAEISVGVGLISPVDPAAVRNNAVVDNDLCKSFTPIALNPKSLRGSNLVEKPKCAPATRNLSGLSSSSSSFPEQAEIHLADRYLGRRVDLRILQAKREVVTEEEVLLGLPTVPTQTVLHQNYPNPFNPSTIIRYELAVTGRVRLRVYNVQGALVRILEDRNREPGRYEIGWNGENERGARVVSGVYFYQLSGPGFTQTRKMSLLK